MAVRHRIKELLEKKEKRERRTISIPQLAKEAGIPRQTLYPYMNLPNDTLTTITASVAERLCIYFQCPLGELLYVDQSMQQPEAQQ
jgi:DNA-binding Xre family transcriptional regulator